jgi:dTDP-4-dehydrorhamnose reductase
MRVLVFGAGGMLGRDLLQEWTTDELIASRSSDTDIRDLSQVRAIVQRVSPDWIVQAAAYTDVDGSERHPELAFAINSQGSDNVALSATEVAAKVLYISTDYVFDGRSSRPYEPDDPVSPLNIYGKSKVAAEQAIQRHSGDWCIVRTSWLFGASRPSFPQKILQAAQSRPELRVVNDQVGSPTSTRDLACALRDLVRMGARGIVHAANEGCCSWFDFARETLRQAGRESVGILPISTAESGRLANRPSYSVLSPGSINAKGIRLRNWKDALRAYLDELKQTERI